MKTNTKRMLSLFLATVVLLFGIQKTYAGTYVISFSSSGIVTTLDSIVVLNHTKGTKLKLAATDVLSLNVTTSIHQISDNSELISVYPNPVTEQSKLTFYANRAGSALIKVVAMDGKTIAQSRNDVTEGNNTFLLSLPKGLFVVAVDGTDFSYSAKAWSQSVVSKEAKIEFLASEKVHSTSLLRSQNATVNMEYNTGDKLLYKAYSGNYSNTVADVPTASKNVNFKYAECKDASGNYYYNFVTIGTQVWMVENLRTSKFNNGVAFSNYTNNDVWKNLEAVRKTPGWCNSFNDATTDVKFGKLYNSTAANDARGINPAGWHLPTKDELETLESLLISKGYNYDATSTIYNSLNNSLSANTDWGINAGAGTPGFDPTKNNATGFNALPTGYRGGDGVFYAGFNAYWSSTTTAGGYTTYMAQIRGDSKNFWITNFINQIGFSVRCIMD